MDGLRCWCPQCGEELEVRSRELEEEFERLMRVAEEMRQMLREIVPELIERRTA